MSSLVSSLWHEGQPGELIRWPSPVHNLSSRTCAGSERTALKERQRRRETPTTQKETAIFSHSSQAPNKHRGGLCGRGASTTPHASGKKRLQAVRAGSSGLDASRALDLVRRERQRERERERESERDSQGACPLLCCAEEETESSLLQKWGVVTLKQKRRAAGLSPSLQGHLHVRCSILQCTNRGGRITSG